MCQVETVNKNMDSICNYSGNDGLNRSLIMVVATFN